MIELTPFEETSIGKYLQQRAEEKGRQEGLRSGELLGKIELLEMLLHQPPTPRSQLTALSPTELQRRVEQLQAEFSPK